MGKMTALAGKDRPSGSARYVGRVGGLACALGVGAAVLTGGGMASADATDGSTGSPQPTSADSSASSSPQESGAEQATAGAQSLSTRDPESDGESQSDAGAESDAESADEADAASEADAVNEADEADAASEVDAVNEADEAESVADPMAPEAESTALQADPIVSEAEPTVAETEDLVDQADNQPASQPTRRVSTEPASGADTGLPAADTGLSAPADPATPTSAGFFESFFDNQTPTLAHDVNENTVLEGRIEGALHPEDPDSTQLTYTATTPAHGTVAINPDGTFVYTPDTSYAGQDRFDVTVSDARSGLHIHGFAGLLNLISFGLIGSSGHRTTQTVFIGFERAVVTSGLSSPVDFRFLPDDRIVVAEKGGEIKLVENGTVGDEPLITLSVSTQGERGISGLAVDPDFANNGHVYVAYTTSAIRNRLSRLTVVGNTAGSELVLLQSNEPEALNHHGGALGFGPDGKLYWGVGDNGSGPNSQDLTNIHGKILRLNPDGTIPPDNPTLGAGALPAIYAYGLRNPFRLAFTPNGDLLVADVGAASFEEVNLVTAGGDYGWPSAEGVCTSCSSINPIYTYPRGAGAAITSVLVYDGATLGPAYLDKLFIADLVQGWIKVLTCTPEFTSCGNPQDFDPEAGTTVVLAQGPGGGLYQLTYQPGELVRIAPAGSTSSAA